MRKKLFAICCGFATTLFALDPLQEANEILNQYGYLNLGVGPIPFPIPTFGGGYRFQSNRHGFDLNGSLVIVAPERWGVKMAGRYLHYFSPNLERQFYAGAGPAISPIFFYSSIRGLAGVGISSEFLFGREHLSNSGGRRFWELVVDFPTFTTSEAAYKWGNDRHLIYFPYVYVQYGWGF